LQQQLSELEDSVISSLIKCVEKINQMTWAQVYQTSSKGAGKRGINYEVIQGQIVGGKFQVHSIRLTGKTRARIIRDGAYMRFISIHPDHDGAYE
jgi:hypothetical protein